MDSYCGWLRASLSVFSSQQPTSAIVPTYYVRHIYRDWGCAQAAAWQGIEHKEYHNQVQVQLLLLVLCSTNGFECLSHIIVSCDWRVHTQVDLPNEINNTNLSWPDHDSRIRELQKSFPEHKALYRVILNKGSGLNSYLEIKGGEGRCSLVTLFPCANFLLLFSVSVETDCGLQSGFSADCHIRLPSMHFLQIFSGCWLYNVQLEGNSSVLNLSMFASPIRPLDRGKSKPYLLFYFKGNVH